MLRLALAFQASAEGLSLEDIQSQFKVERRTAERMRDAVREVFPLLEEVDTGERKKRWRLPSRTLQSLISFTAGELAAIHLAAGILKRDRRIEASKALSAVEDKIIGLLPKDAHRKVTVDLEALVEAEGLAFRPGPKINIDPKIIGQIRNAILARKEIKIRHKRRDSGEVHEFPVWPYGFLYGARPYLVAFNPHKKINDYRQYALANIEEVKDTGRDYAHDDTFSFENYTRDSFGVFREEPFDVEWKFSPSAAPDAKDFQFHPNQTVKELRDGSLVVKFKAGGALEMAWHLYTWGDTMEVIKPKDFWKRVEEYGIKSWFDVC